MKKFLIITMAALLATVSCSKDEEEVMKPTLSVSVTPVQIAVGESATYTVKVNPILEEDLMVKIKVDNADLLTVPASVIINKGEKTATFEGVAKGAGFAKVTISNADTEGGIRNATVKIVAKE